MRGLDHVVHAVRDLEAAAGLYRRLGFAVGARNRHPWGTHNCLVQLPGFFVEILSVEEPARIPAHMPGNFSFGAFNRQFLQRTGEGLSCLVLEGQDPAADKAAFDAAGFGGFEQFAFRRKGRRPDGSETEVGFVLAFARDPASPQAAFFTCLQTSPENFWAAELQRHENGARAVAACVLVAENPSDHHIFLETFTGIRAPHASSLGLTFATPRGEVRVVTPRGFADLFGAEHSQFGAEQSLLGAEDRPEQGMFVAALAFAVADLAATAALLERNRVPFCRHRERLVIGPNTAFGAVLAFQAS